ncbi:MAG TPA: hypothetical protein VM115_02695 [Vicinamibacterales bacterium]|nr:hypothetical protein [Vicinamibacterales bacterium]
MIAAHLRLDDAHAIVDVATCDNFQKNVAGMIVARLKASPTDLGRFIDVRSPEVSFYRLTH